jgi:type IV secretory pathway TraG/TraD family ATPase VirD4
VDWLVAIFDKDSAPAAPVAPIVAAIALGIVFFVRVLSGRPAEVHKRGVRVREDAAARRGVRRAARSQRQGAQAEQLSFAGIPVRPGDETKHFKVLGTTGTGKSTAIGELLAKALERGDRAVFADPDGGYRARFFDRYRGDIVLNPFEPCSLKWDPFAEIRNAYDIEQLAGSLIPDTHDRAAGEWRAYARTFLGAVLRSCRRSNRPDCAELWRLMSEASPEELRPVVAGTPAQPFLDPENARMFGSIRSVAVSALAALEHVARQRAAPFSVSRWIRESSAACLFIPYRAGQIQALKSVIATWMRLAIFAAMHGEEGADQHLWFVIDELDALGAIDGLKDALARLRKFGGRCCLGFQSAAQVSSTYGGDAQTIVENCSNTLILRCSASEHGGTSQFASRLIGEREVLRRQISRGSDREGLFARRGERRSKNTSEQRVTEAAVLPSEIEGLPDFCGYLKVASTSEWLKVRFERSRSSDRSGMHGRLRLESRHQRPFQ